MESFCHGASPGLAKVRAVPLVQRRTVELCSVSEKLPSVFTAVTLTLNPTLIVLLELSTIVSL